MSVLEQSWGKRGLWRAESSSAEPCEWMGPPLGRKDPVITRSGEGDAALIKSDVHYNS